MSAFGSFTPAFGGIGGAGPADTDAVKKHDYDRLFRAAVSDCPAEEFGQLLESVCDDYTAQQENNPFGGFGTPDSTALPRLLLGIALQRRDTAKAALITEYIGRNGGVTDLSSCMSIYISVLLSGDMELIADFIKTNFGSGSGFSVSFVIPKCYVSYTDIPFDDLLYWLMITGGYKAGAESIRGVMMKTFGDSAADTVISAVRFRDKQFLTALFGAGFTFGTDIILRLLFFPDELMWLAEELGELIFEDKPPAEMTVRGVLGALLDGEQRFSLIKQLCTCSAREYDVYKGIDLSMLPKASVCDFADTFEFTGDCIDYMSVHARELFAPEVTATVCSSVGVETAERIFSGSGIKLNIRVDMTDRYYSYSDYMDILGKDYELLLSHGDEQLPPALIRMLDTDNRNIYKRMVKKGIINKENVGQVIEYAAERKLMRGICAINRQYGSMA